MRLQLKALLLVMAATSSFSLEVHADGDESLCRYFAKQGLSRLNQGDQIGAKKLCLSAGRCSPGQVRASKFWKLATPENSTAIKNELMEYTDVWGHVSYLHIRGARHPVVRISRVVGTAYCIRDTYLVRDKSGYSLLRNSVLNDFSEEAGHCMYEDVYYANYRSKTYAVLRGLNEHSRSTTVYIAYPDFNLSLVCKASYKMP